MWWWRGREDRWLVQGHTHGRASLPTRQSGSGACIPVLCSCLVSSEVTAGHWISKQSERPCMCRSPGWPSLNVGTRWASSRGYLHKQISSPGCRANLVNWRQPPLASVCSDPKDTGVTCCRLVCVDTPCLSSFRCLPMGEMEEAWSLLLMQYCQQSQSLWPCVLCVHTITSNLGLW